MNDVEWRDVEGYLVSDEGDVVSLHGGTRRVLKPSLDRYGYLRVGLSKGGKTCTMFVHRLVAKAFCEGYEEGLTVNHIDENKINNVSSNLEWVSRGDNARWSNNLSWIVTLPSGVEVEVTNLNQFCKYMDLKQSNMSSVANGKLPHHKGYKVRRSVKNV